VFYVFELGSSMPTWTKFKYVVKLGLHTTCKFSISKSYLNSIHVCLYKFNSSIYVNSFYVSKNVNSF